MFWLPAPRLCARLRPDATDEEALMHDLQIRPATVADVPARSALAQHVRVGYETTTFEERVNDGSIWLMRKMLPG